MQQQADRSLRIGRFFKRPGIPHLERAEFEKSNLSAQQQANDAKQYKLSIFLTRERDQARFEYLLHKERSGVNARPLRLFLNFATTGPAIAIFLRQASDADVALMIDAMTSSPVGLPRSVKPPFTCKTCPVMKQLSSDNQTTASAISSDVPMRPRG